MPQKIFLKSCVSNLIQKIAQSKRHQQPAYHSCNGIRHYSDESDFPATTVGSKDSAALNTPVQRAQTILDAFNPSGDRKNDYLIHDSATIKDAIDHLVRRSIGASMVTNSKEEIVGIFTARDILRFLSHNGVPGGQYADFSSMGDPHHNFNAGIGKGGRMSDVMGRRVTETMVPADKLVYCLPTDSRRRCREIMFQSKVR